MFSSKKKYRSLAPIAVGASCFFLLIGSLTPAQAATKVTTIQLWGRDSTASFLKPLAEAFNKSQNKIKVVTTIITGENGFDLKFAAGSASGDVPDVTSLDLIAVAKYARGKALLDLSSRIKEISYIKDFDAAHMGTVKWEGKYYALPFNAEASVLYYNKTLFKKAGLDPNSPPKTWAEMETAAKAITALGDGIKGFYMSGNCGGCNLFVVTPYITAAGGDILTKGPKAANLDFDSKPVLEAITFLNKMWKNGYMPKDAQVDTGANFYATFSTGTIGMQGGGAFGIGDLISKGQVDFGTTALPGKVAGQQSSFAGGDDIVIPAKSKHPKEAWTFVKWATSVTAQRMLADMSITPVRTSVATGYYAKKDPRLATLARALQVGKTQQGPDVQAIFNNADSPWVELLQNGIFGDDPAAAVKVAQAKALKLITKK